MIFGPVAVALLLLFTPQAVRENVPVAPANSHCPQWFATALNAGFTEDQWPTIDRIMWCESKCSPTAHNPSGASGLMQEMPLWWNGRDPFDPDANLAMAKETYDTQGWHAWSCF